MGTAAQKRPSFGELYDEIRRLPEGMTGEILEPGVLRTMGRPGKAHRRAAKRCLASLSPDDPDFGGSGWWIETEVEIRLGERLIVPDLSGWRIERVPELPDENPLQVLPDWCCEVLSPSTARDDKHLKLPLYSRSGVPWIWLIDPAIRLVEAYETVNGFPTLKVTAAEQERLVLPPFAHEIDVSTWWLEGARPAT